MRNFIFVICFFSFLFLTPLSFAQWENPPTALPASDGAIADEYGFSVDLAEDVAIVGAPYHDHLGENSGAAYVLRQTGGTWGEEQELLAWDGAANDEFGYAVAISGNFAVIGAPQHAGHGGAYVYRFNGINWVQDQKLVPSDLMSGDHFGWDLAISGDMILANAPYHNNYAGTVYVYRYNGQSWIQEQKITPPQSAANFFGLGVSLWGNVAVISNPNNTINGLSSGAAYVFRYDGQHWLEEQMIFPQDGSSNLIFSRTIDVFENVVIVGSNDHENGAGSGSAYVYRFDGNNWNQEQKLLASDGLGGDQFGSAVSVYGNLIAIGAPGRTIYDPYWMPSYGAVYVFRNDGENWLEEFLLVLEVGPQGAGWAWDETGNSVSIHENSILVGSHLNDNEISDSGNAFIFEGEVVATECTGDIDNDNDVGVTDFLVLLAAWGPNPGHPADFNDDGVVDVQDFLDLLAAWGPC